jgi:hypothetical protein
MADRAKLSSRPPWGITISRIRAFSTEVDTGSRKENASKQESGASFRFNRNGKGPRIPDSKIAREAAELVRQYETEMLFNHSVHVFVFGTLRGVRQNLKFDSELLYVAALFHDLCLVDHFHTETKWFEVDEADAAREFLRSHGISEPKADLVWEAIALHTTPGIPQYMRPEIALTNAGVAGSTRRATQPKSVNTPSQEYFGLSEEKLSVWFARLTRSRGASRSSRVLR